MTQIKMSTRKDDNTPNTNITVVSALLHIKKLDGQNNYNSWKFLIELYLIHEDLWECVISNRNDMDLTSEEKRRDQRARAKIWLMILFNQASVAIQKNDSRPENKIYRGTVK